MAYSTPAAEAFVKDVKGELGSQKDVKRAMEALYGPTFPLIKDKPSPEDWADFNQDRWEHSSRGMDEALHLSARNRLFAEGRQWVSSAGKYGQWKEPPAPKSQVQAVFDLIGPALDYRLQVITENRPGWRFTPGNMDADRQKKAEAWQRFVEYQWHQQKMQAVLREAEFYAQRDGVSFMLTFWDPEGGPQDEAGSLGDIGSKVYRIEQVRVSPNATANKRPIYWVFRESIPKMEAVAAYGSDVLDADDDGHDTGSYESSYRYRNSFAEDSQAPLYGGHDTVDRFLTFFEPNQYFPQGLVCVTVGRKLVYGPVALPVKKVPVVRVTDGSASPLFFPPAIMNRWVPVQQRVNTLVSKALESIRLNVGGRFITRPGALSSETLVGGQFSALEVRSFGNIDEAVKPVTGFSIGADLKEFLDREIRQFENLSGWNDTARGSFSSEQSGRAILAIREQLERTLAPSVNAASEAMAEWAWLCIEWARWGYTMPRSIGVVGENRPDLAREITQEDLNGVVDVYVDPETMSVMPRAMKLYLLEDALQKGVIDAREYRQRMPFGFVNDFATPDDVQEAKARRVVESIRNGQPPEPMAWQDNEAIHQTIIERDILLAPNIDPMVMQAANQRWTELANQASAKMAPPPMQGASQPSGGQQGPPQGGQQGLPVPPEQQPMLGTSPSTASAPLGMLTGQADQTMAAQLFESTSPQ